MKKQVLSIAVALATLLCACSPAAQPTSTTTTTSKAGDASVTTDMTTATDNSTEMTGDTTVTNGVTVGSTASTVSATASSMITTNKTTSKANQTTTTTHKVTTTTAFVSTGDAMADKYFSLRDGLKNTYVKLTQEKELTIAYMGGSVTYGIGTSDYNTGPYRVRVTNWLQEQFPDAQITAHNMAVGNACSEYGAYTAEYVGEELQPDLVFVEFAINDYYMKAKNDAKRVSMQYEAIIRKLRQANPDCDIVAVYVTEKWLSLGTGRFEQVVTQDTIAAHYGVPAVNVGLWLRDEENQTNAWGNWTTYFTDDVHPTDVGYACYGNYICRSLDIAFDFAKGEKTVTNHTLPAAYNSEQLKTKTYYVREMDLSGISNLTFVERKIFGMPGYIQPNLGSVWTMTFTGTEVAVFASGGHDIYWSIDGSKMEKISTNGPYPLVLSRDLADGTHTLKISAAGTSLFYYAVFARQK